MSIRIPSWWAVSSGALKSTIRNSAESLAAHSEDVVVQKLRWGREKDLSDITDVLFVSGAHLDYDYIEFWCDEHDTSDRLASVRSKLPPEFGGPS